MSSEESQMPPKPTDPGVRTVKVAVIKAGIDAGIYDNDHRLNIAIDRLLDDINA